MLAGKLFELMGWVGWPVQATCCSSCCCVVAAPSCGAGRFWLLLLMLVLTAVSLFGLQPLLAQLKADALPREVMESVLRNRFAAWHGVSSILYLVQSVLGLLLVTSAGVAPGKVVCWKKDSRCSGDAFSGDFQWQRDQRCEPSWRLRLLER
jgi:MFS family permease